MTMENYMIIRTFKHKFLKTIYYVQDYMIYELLNQYNGDPYTKLLNETGYIEQENAVIPKTLWDKNEFGGMFYEDWTWVEESLIEAGNKIVKQDLKNKLERKIQELCEE